ncbi:MAG TPA: U32 family peptidase [Clostridia bacterium]
MKRVELLAPAGNMEKLKTALYFGADAVYMGGRNFSLRQYSQNFSLEEIFKAAKLTHDLGKKLYITVNVFARDKDFGELSEYLKVLEEAQVDAVIVSDLGVMDYVLNNTKLDVHVSTQANTTNARAIDFYARLGVKRVILARELTLDEIKTIKQNLKSDIEIEAFVHGAMCISYSGRCLLSNYFTGRDSNRGECVQACRWDYILFQDTKPDKPLIINQDEKGTYILNSKDLNMLGYLDQLIDAGISSFKIEGRMKTAYYVATIVNAYKRALDCLYNNQPVPEYILQEPYKTSHREFTTGFYFNKPEEYYETSRSVQSYDFVALVKGYDDGRALIEQRNRFEIGDRLEILSPADSFLKTITIDKMVDLDGNPVKVADKVQQELYIYTDIKLNSGDILRKQQKNS